MPTHAHQKPMGMGMGMGTQCKALVTTLLLSELVPCSLFIHVVAISGTTL